ncbi:MAG: hypothetical protein K2L18_11685 [Acetatifactor sp.]|nr:hypothetical protein [Acetatifactor sp.]
MSSELTAEKGIHRIYVDYLKELCGFLVQHGKKPMFWGDVICGDPMLARELPQETVCLTWGYAPDQREEESRRMAEAGIRQYLCPGVSGWNQWMNQIDDSYQNITRMCAYARKYQAGGILNTDWGDFGHINHTEHSAVGMIYGAAFSWNGEEIPREEINRQISVLEYKDGSGRLVELMAELAACSDFCWYDAVMYYEALARGESEVDPELVRWSGSRSIAWEKVLETAKRLRNLRQEFGRTAIGMDSAKRGLMQDLDMTAEGMDIWNQVGAMLSASAAGEPADETSAFALAQRLEQWFMAYKEVWRQVGKEGELPRIAEIVFWYADLLRGRKRRSRK